MCTYLFILGTPKVQIIFSFFGSFFSFRWVGGLALGEWDRIGGGVVVKNNNFLTFFSEKGLEAHFLGVRVYQGLPTLD